MFQDELTEHPIAFNTSPFLFVGSGLSRRYFKTEPWFALLEKIAAFIHLAKPFKYYTSNADDDLAAAASITGEEFNEIWWTNIEFEHSRAVCLYDYFKYKYPFVKSQQ